MSTPEQHPVLRGGCYCGSVSFSVNSAPVLSAYCHCTICQRLLCKNSFPDHIELFSSFFSLPFCTFNTPPRIGLFLDTPRASRITSPLIQPRRKASQDSLALQELWIQHIIVQFKDRSMECLGLRTRARRRRAHQELGYCQAHLPYVLWDESDRGR